MKETLLGTIEDDGDISSCSIELDSVNIVDYFIDKDGNAKAPYNIPQKIRTVGTAKALGEAVFVSIDIGDIDEDVVREYFGYKEYVAGDTFTHNKLENFRTACAIFNLAYQSTTIDDLVDKFRESIM